MTLQSLLNMARRRMGRRRISGERQRTQLLKRMPQGAHCAEIGVWKGDLSHYILDLTKPSHLHLVDPWLFCPEVPNRLYGGSEAKNQGDMDRIAQAVMDAFAKDPRVSIHRMRSADFFARAPRLDWVYLDGDHSYDAVMADLSGAWNAVVPGGVICGDDYLWRDSAGMAPVQRAVTDFSREAHAELEVFRNQFILWR